jgi:uncharacterized membrane protein
LKKGIFKKFSKKFYFIPILYVGIFVLIAMMFIALDYQGEYIPNIFLTGIELGTTILIMVIGTMATLLTASFSIIMIVLTLYENQLSPRTLQDFLEKRITQRIIGYYVGALVFSIISLFEIKMGMESSLVVTPTVSIFFLVTGILVFIFFMHHISKSIQSTVFILNIVEEADRLLSKKQKMIKDDPNISSESIENFSELIDGNSIDISMEKSGFIKLYNEEGLFSFASRQGLTLYFERKVGEHIMEDVPVIKVFNYSGSLSSDELAAEIRGMVEIGDVPNIENIYDKTHKLVEITVRALSPGINDPSTAEFCIERVGYLLQKAAKISESKIYKDEEGEVRLILKGITFKNLLFEHFYQIKHYGLEDLKIHNALILALNYISKGSNYQIRKQIWAFGMYLLNDINLDDVADMEKTYLLERYYQLSRVTGQKFEMNKYYSIGGK